MSLAYLLAVNDCIYGGKAHAGPLRIRHWPLLFSASGESKTPETTPSGSLEAIARSAPFAPRTRTSPPTQQWLRLTVIALLTLLCLGASGSRHTRQCTASAVSFMTVGPAF